MQNKGKESTLQFDIAEDVRPSLAGVAAAAMSARDGA
jgi:hypothetical protein